MNSRVAVCSGAIVAMLFASVISAIGAAEVDEKALREAVTFYASFDEARRGDFGGGDLTLWTRYDHPTNKGEKVVVHEIDTDRIQIVRDRDVPGGGVRGGALQFKSVLPRNGFVFVPARGNVAFHKGGWGGAVSLWVYYEPETKLFDPVILVQKAYNNGSVWCDLTAPDADGSRTLRIGAYSASSAAKPALPAADTAAADPDKPEVHVKADALLPRRWHHLVLNWGNFDTGRADGYVELYAAGRLLAALRDRETHLDWDLDATRIHLGNALVGKLDEVAVFARPLREQEVVHLFEHPDWLKSP